MVWLMLIESEIVITGEFFILLFGYFVHQINLYTWNRYICYDLLFINVLFYYVLTYLSGR